MSMFDNLKKAAADTFTEDIKMIDVDNLIASEDNFFDVNNIEEFAETILGQGGVKENLIVRPIEDEDGETRNYEIISGHRRTAAIKLLLEKGENISRLLPCLVINYSDEDTKILDLIFMNTSSRQLSDNEIWKAYELLDRILKTKKKLGEKFGRARDKIADMLNISTGQVSKMDNIKNNATNEVKELVETGEMSISTANELSKLDRKKQREILNSKPASEIKATDITPRKNYIDSEKSATSDTKFDTDEKDNNFSENDDNTVENDFENDIENEVETENFSENVDENSFENDIKNDVESENFSENADSTIENIVENVIEIADENENLSEDTAKMSDFTFKLHNWAVNYVKENVHFITTGIDVYLNYTDDDEIKKETKKAFEALQLIFDDIQQAELNKIKYNFQ